MKGKRVRSISGDAARESLHYAIGKSSLGDILVARSETGVRAILFGDDRQRLARDFTSMFPQADCVDAGEALAECLAAAAALAEAPWRGFAPPLDIRGTEFQLRVWRALRDIPPGTTTSYSDVAKSIAAPGALRAVAGACAANVLAIVIPCHRVLRANGSLSGYRWGMERKRQLIAREKAAPPATN